MKNYNFVIIGGGIVGLTVARSLLQRKLGTVCILEKEASLGMHSSGRNSGVLHSGIYYPPNSLKAKICLSGAKKMADYANSHRISMLKTGKVIVAKNAEEFSKLHELYERGIQNGVSVRRISVKELKEIEPEAATHEGALHITDTGVINSKQVLHALENEITAMGAKLIYSARAEKIEEKVVYLKDEKISFGHLINAAGLHADNIAHAMGVGLDYCIVPFKGIYRKLSKEAAARFRGSIYPAPDLAMPFLGVHITRVVSGDVYAGPTAIPAFGRENYGVLRGIDSDFFSIAYHLSTMMVKNTNNLRGLIAQEIPNYLPSVFLKRVKSLAPGLKREDLEPCDKVGLRAQLMDKRSLKFVMDFLVEKGPNSTHILNAISPAFTSSFAFAEIIVDGVSS